MRSLRQTRRWGESLLSVSPVLPDIPQGSAVQERLAYGHSSKGQPKTQAGWRYLGEVDCCLSKLTSSVHKINSGQKPTRTTPVNPSTYCAQDIGAQPTVPEMAIIQRIQTLDPEKWEIGHCFEYRKGFPKEATI